MQAAPAIRVSRHPGALPDLEPAVERQRLLVELRETKPLDEATCRAFLRQLADLCTWHAVADPVAQRVDGGFAAWLLAVEGGVQLQAWTAPAALVCLDIVGRRPFEPRDVVSFATLYFAARHAVAGDPADADGYLEVSAEALELRQLCDWAISEARTGRDLARATALVVGAGLELELAAPLLARIGDGIRQLHATGDPKLALAHGEGLGEALSRLRQSGVDVSPVAPWTVQASRVEAALADGPERPRHEHALHERRSPEDGDPAVTRRAAGVRPAARRGEGSES